MAAEERPICLSVRRGGGRRETWEQLGTERPEYHRKRRITTEQKARRVNNFAPLGRSAKPRSSIQFRGASKFSLICSSLTCPLAESCEHRHSGSDQTCP